MTGIVIRGSAERRPRRPRHPWQHVLRERDEPPGARRLHPDPRRQRRLRRRLPRNRVAERRLARSVLAGFEAPGSTQESRSASFLAVVPVRPKKVFGCPPTSGSAARDPRVPGPIRGREPADRLGMPDRVGGDERFERLARDHARARPTAETADRLPVEEHRARLQITRAGRADDVGDRMLRGISSADAVVSAGTSGLIAPILTHERGDGGLRV